MSLLRRVAVVVVLVVVVLLLMVVVCNPENGRAGKSHSKGEVGRVSSSHRYCHHCFWGEDFVQQVGVLAIVALYPQTKTKIHGLGIPKPAWEVAPDIVDCTTPPGMVLTIRQKY